MGKKRQTQYTHIIKVKMYENKHKQVKDKHTYAKIPIHAHTHIKLKPQIYLELKPLIEALN